MAKSTRGVRPGPKRPFLSTTPSSFQRLGRHQPAPDLSRDARRRLAMLEWQAATDALAHASSPVRTIR